MFLPIVLAVANFFLNWTGERLGRIPGMDIIPFSVMVIAWNGENLFFGVGLVVLGYVLPAIHRVQYLPFMLPAIFILSLLSVFIHWGFFLLILYHLMGLGMAYAFGFISPRYMSFMGVHLVLNGFLLWAYGLVF